MQIGSFLCWYKAAPALNLQLWERSSSPGFAGAPIRGSGQNTHHGVWADLVVLVAILQGNFWRTRDTEDVSGYEWGNQWMCDSLLTRVSLCLQVSSVRCSWWSLEEAWYSQGGLWDSLVQRLVSRSIAMPWAGSARLQGSGWTGSQVLVVVAAHTVQTLWRADSPSPGTTPRTRCIWK